MNIENDTSAAPPPVAYCKCPKGKEEPSRKGNRHQTPRGRIAKVQTDGKEFTMANITRKQLATALMAEGVAPFIADTMNADVEDVTAAIEKLHQSTTRKTAYKPSKETVRNRQIAAELADEINARNAEFTAKDIAEFYTDPDGMTLKSRKVGALLRQAVNMGLIAVSPEPWGVKHYAPLGFEFAKKPVRVVRSTKSKDAENAAE